MPAPLLHVLGLGLKLPPQQRAQPLHDLLVQRAVQTCCFTFREVRDGPTAEWLCKFRGHGGIEKFHGLDGLRLPWDRYLQELFDAPEEQIVVQSRLMRHRGVSANNPYLQPTPMEYEHVVVPSQLGERVVRAACTIALEWQADLSLMGAENDEQLRRHRREVRTGAEDDERNTTLPVFSLDPEHAASPYRAGNYDLVKLLATRQAYRQMVRECEEKPARRQAHAFLLRFAEAHALDGEQPYHAADAWLASLLAQPYVIASAEGGAVEGMSLLDPLELAEDLMTRRAALAEQWVETLEEVPEQMLQLKREWLGRASEADPIEAPE